MEGGSGGREGGGGGTGAWSATFLFLFFVLKSIRLVQDFFFRFYFCVC